MKLNAENVRFARENASNRLRRWVVEKMWGFKSKLSGESFREYWKHKWGRALRIQSLYRGYCARERTLRMKIKLATAHYAAAMVQRVFRGSRILHWRDMRLNVVSAYVLDRQFLERRGAVEESRMRYKAFMTENQRDSASEPDDDDVEPNWLENFDASRGRKYWTNFATNDIVSVEVLCCGVSVMLLCSVVV